MIRSMVRWVLNEAWEKVNLPGVWQELKKLGKQHGRRFFVAAVLWEVIEDVVFPFLSWWAGVPELIPLFLVLHFEPIVYPAFFWGFRMYDRAKGRIPWEPDRGAQSSYWRSAGKVVVYKLAATGWFATIMLGLGLLPWALAAYVGLMTAFGFVHERIWHDSNYGIREDDSVQIRRVLGKALTYSIVSVMVLYPIFRVSFGSVPWLALGACQGAGLLLYLALEAVWSKSEWGIGRIERAA